MAKALYIAEKPSVAQEFAKVLKLNTSRKDGYLEGETAIVTWCVGHLVTMSYPECYDSRLKKWSLDTLPFLPEEFLYEVIPSVKKQFDTVSTLLNRPDVDCIYVCTDSGREGEYIYRLVAQMAGVKEKEQRRVWIDSQTEEEILRGIREAKDLSAYDNLSAAAYLRAKEDYLMGINFSRVLSLKYSNLISNEMHTKYTVISVGRVMTCVLGMIVRREREIRQFVKTPFYRVFLQADKDGTALEGEFRTTETSAWYQNPAMYKENGFKKREDAQKLIDTLDVESSKKAIIKTIERRQEKKNPPLLYNLAELQNECSKCFKISPDQTLQIVQELYEKKLVTYPRTDARVLSTAVAKEIHKNIQGISAYAPVGSFAKQILEQERFKGIAKTRYVNDKQITDHYAIVPTGQGLRSLSGLSGVRESVYEMICRRFLSVFYPPAVYQKVSMVFGVEQESFFSNYRVLIDPGYLTVLNRSVPKKKMEDNTSEDETDCDSDMLEILKNLKKGMEIDRKGFVIREGETSPPKRYNSGSMILAMENAGQLIEDEELRAQIKGSGIGTSATRAEILKKLVSISYISLNKKTQTLTPTHLGEMIYDVVFASLRPLLNPDLTASWEKGLNYVAEGSITSDEYQKKLDDFVGRRVNGVKNLNNQYLLRGTFQQTAEFYKKGSKKQ